MNPTLLKESAQQFKASVLKEDGVGTTDLKYYIEGVFLQAEVKNGNGRIYPLRVLQEAVNIYRDEFITKRRALGELGHPDDPGIHWKDVCLNVESVVEEGNNFIGKAKILPTPCGSILKGLIDEGIQLGVSSRGLGEVKNSIVQNGFRLVSLIDVVHDPSAPDAFVTALVEDKEWVWESGLLVEKDFSALKKAVKSANRSLIDQKRAQIFSSFLTSLL